MLEFVTQAGAAMWLGILTSISPCPLATNVAAVSYIGRTCSGSGAVRTGILYAVGRSLAYAGLGAILVYGALSAPVVSHALQKWMIRALGPFLLVSALLIGGWLRLSLKGVEISDRIKARAARAGVAGGAFLGFLFALTFCPVSAALFFGALLPVALEARSPLALPAIYGVGTAIPALVAAVALAAGAGGVSRLFHVAGTLDTWARRVTAIVFAVIGAWFTWRYTFGVGL